MLIEAAGIAYFVVNAALLAGVSPFDFIFAAMFSVTFHINLMAFVYFVALVSGRVRIAAMFQMLSFVYFCFATLFWFGIIIVKYPVFRIKVIVAMVMYAFGMVVPVTLSLSKHPLKWPNLWWAFVYPVVYVALHPAIYSFMGWNTPLFDEYVPLYVIAFVAWLNVCDIFIKPS